MPVVVGRSVLLSVVDVFIGGSGYDSASPATSNEWSDLGKKLFSAGGDEDESRSKRMEAVRSVLEVGNVTWCEEQVRILLSTTELETLEI